MDSWQWWVGTFVTFIVGSYAWMNRQQKMTQEETIKNMQEKISTLERDMAVLKETSLSEKEVRIIIQDSLEPLTELISKIDNHIENLQSDVTSIKISLGKRGD